MDALVWPAAGAAAFAATAAAARLARPAVRARARAPVIAAAVLTAALAAGLDGPDATGLAALDALYRGLTAAIVVRYAPRTRRRTLLAAAVLALLASHPSPLAAAGAAAAVGIVAAMRLTVGYSRVLMTLAAAFVAVAAQHAAWPTRHGATTLVGVIVYALILVPACKARTIVRTALAAAAFAVVAGALTAVAGMAATQPLRSAVNASEAALRAARQGNDDATDAALGRAQSSFGDARDAARSPLLFPARVTPVLAQHVRTLDRAASAGYVLARQGRDSLAAVAFDRLDVVGGGVDTAALRTLGEAVDKARSAIGVALGQVDEARSPWLLPPVGKVIDRQHARLRTARADADVAADVAQFVPALLGGETGPRRYFLAIVTPVESRASGGLIGNFGEIEARDGGLRLTRLGRSLELNRGGNRAARTITGPPDYLRRYGQFEPATTWQNVNMSPDFPTVADVIGQLYPQSGGQPVGGVISIDPTGLAALLRLTGPIDVPGWPEPVTARNAEQILYFDQYVRFENDDRVDFLGAVAGKVVERLTSGRVGGIRRVVDALRPAVQGRHLMVASLDPAEADFLDRVGVSGRMAPRPVDHLSVVTQNAGGNKIDWFLHRSVDYRATVGDDGSLDAEVTVHLRNDAPAGGLPKSVIGNVAQPPAPAGVNRLYLSVYSPWLLQDAALGDGTPLAMTSDTEAGLVVHSAFIDVPAGQSVAVRLRLRGTLPGTAYRLDVGRQPLVHDDRLTLDVRAADGARLVAADATVDRHLTFRAGRGL